LRATALLVGGGTTAGETAKLHVITLSVARDGTEPVPLAPGGVLRMAVGSAENEG
jgi:hypothetical protein